MDFVSDHLSSERCFRALTVVDIHCRVSPGILAETSISGERVGRFLDEIAAGGELPLGIVVDNGPEISRRSSTNACTKTRSRHKRWDSFLG